MFCYIMKKMNKGQKQKISEFSFTGIKSQGKFLNEQ